MCKTCDATYAVAKVLADAGLTGPNGTMRTIEEANDALTVAVNVAAACIATLPSREMRDSATAWVKDAVKDQVKKRRAGKATHH